jgi:hypothetical protein
MFWNELPCGLPQGSVKLMYEYKMGICFSKQTGYELSKVVPQVFSPQLQLWENIQIINPRKPIYRFGNLCNRTYAKVFHIPSKM